MSIQYSATGTAGQTYTVTRDIAGGGFTPRVDGTVIAAAGRLGRARSAAARHNGHGLNWTDENAVRFGHSQQ